MGEWQMRTGPRRKIKILKNMQTARCGHDVDMIMMIVRDERLIG